MAPFPKLAANIEQCVEQEIYEMREHPELEAEILHLRSGCAQPPLGPNLGAPTATTPTADHAHLFAKFLVREVGREGRRPVFGKDNAATGRLRLRRRAGGAPGGGARIAGAGSVPTRHVEPTQAAAMTRFLKNQAPIVAAKGQQL